MAVVLSAFDSPLGGITLAAEDDCLTGLWFDGQKYDRDCLAGRAAAYGDSPVFSETRRWLEAYFAGRDPGFTPPLRIPGPPFRQLIAELMLAIPYGSVTTYGELARAAARRLGKASMSAQAVGGAVGHNSISVIVPCHRVLGSDLRLTGYAGGLARKTALLTLEGHAVADGRLISGDAPMRFPTGQIFH